MSKKRSAGAQPLARASTPQRMSSASMAATSGPTRTGSTGRLDDRRRRELEGQEPAAQEDAALRGEERPDRMGRGEPRRQASEPADVACRPYDAPVGVVGGALGRRRGAPELPVARRPVRGVLREEPVEEGRPGARKPGEDERPSDLLVADLGVLPPIVLDAEPVHEHAAQIVARGDAADESQARLGLDRGEETLERLAEGRIAEVVEAGTPARG